MINQVVLVGRLKEEIEWYDDFAVITLAVPRPYKNEDGEYDIDIIKCKMDDKMANNAEEYCHKGDIIGIKGKLENLTGNIEIVIEKMSFLSSKSTNEEDNEE